MTKKVIAKKTVHCDSCGKEIAAGKRMYLGPDWWACSPKCVAELTAEDDAEFATFNEALDAL